MKANELRIGNLVNHSIYGECEITALDYEMICIQRNDLDIKEWFDLKDFQPIPLTEEKLLKFGFDKRMFGWWSSVLFLRIDENEKCFWFDWSGTNESNGTELFFVHKLQNLYFELTNEELTFKLE